MIRLKVADTHDLQWIAWWLSDPDLRQSARCDPAPLSIQDLLEYIKHEIALTFIIVLDSPKNPPEYIGYCRIAHTHMGIANIGIVIADPHFRHKGIGTYVGIALLGICTCLGKPVVTWATLADNEASIKLAQKLGFISIVKPKDGEEPAPEGGRKIQLYVKDLRQLGRTPYEENNTVEQTKNTPGK